MNERQEDPDLAAIEAIYDALDAGDADGALARVRAVIEAEEADDPVLHFLAGVALVELDRAAEAVQELRRAVELDPDDAEFRANLALALFLGCEFVEASREASRAVECDPQLPDAHHVRALTLEREDRWDEADEHFRRAERIDPDAFPAPRRISRDEFEAEVGRAAERLSEEFRRYLDEVAVTVDDLPADEILRDETPPLDPELLGLFVGTALDQRSAFSPGGELPPRILLFKRNLERVYPERDELVVQIARTLHHELGHYLGLDEDELRAIDLD